MMTERKSIEIDFCTQCRGIWLDRGELDKIIDLSTKELMAPSPERESTRKRTEFKPAKSDPARQYRGGRFNRDGDDDDDRRRDRSYDSDRDRKRSREDRYDRKPYRIQKSLLNTLFDIID